ncbi:hypothetical protein SOVF_216020, partial [Spinacia oleracea]
MLDEINWAKTRLVSDNSEQSAEQLKSEINNLKPELSATDTNTLEEQSKWGNGLKLK